jgi:hypothetical protein
MEIESAPAKLTHDPDPYVNQIPKSQILCFIHSYVSVVYVLIYFLYLLFGLPCVTRVLFSYLNFRGGV